MGVPGRRRRGDRPGGDRGAPQLLPPLLRRARLRRGAAPLPRPTRGAGPARRREGALAGDSDRAGRAGMTETYGARDLMRSAEIKQIVRCAYAAVDSSSERLARKLYSPEELARMPQSAIDGALGVGNHLRHADIDAGETLLDLGCGAGIDTILAAQRTGPTGRVIALDFLPEMLERTEQAAHEAGLENVETLEAEMEEIPLPDASVDVVISNGVINLSPRKARALAECARVLRPGGELCVSDLTVEEELPPEILTHPAAWAG